MEDSLVSDVIYWSALFLPYVVMFFFAGRCYLGKSSGSPFVVLPLSSFVSAVILYAFPLWEAMTNDKTGEQALGNLAVILLFMFAFVVLMILSLISAFIVRKFGKKNNVNDQN